MKKPIRILTTDMDIVGEIDNYESMFFIRSWHGIGSIELRINRYKKHAYALQKDSLILVGNDLNKVFIIKHREIELDENGKITENWLIKGYALKSIVAQRITMPPLHTAYDNRSSNAETVMKHYINTNIINPVDSRRRIPNLVIAPNLQRGIPISYSSRFKNLAEEMSTLSLASGLGWDVTLDIDNKLWVFDVVEGKDLTADQIINPPVIFSPQFESVKNMQYVQSDLNYKNVGIVAGQGEGVERRVIEIGSFSGLNRHEVFIDARDVEEMDEDEQPIPEQQVIQKLTDRGQQQLNELLQEEYLEAQLLTPISRTEYEREFSYLSTLQISESVTKRTRTLSAFNYQLDYDLGDIVTVQNKDWGVTLNARITEVKEIYQENGFGLEATFGNNRPTLIQKIKQELSQMSGEVRR